MDTVLADTAVSAGDSKRPLLESLSALRMLLIGGLVLPGEVPTFMRLAADLSAAVKAQYPSLAMKPLDDLLARIPRIRDPDAVLLTARNFVDGLALLLSERETENSLLRIRVARPPMGLVAMAVLVLAVLAGTIWYNQNFTNDVIFPMRQERLADLSAIKTALEAYRAENGAYPASEGGGTEWNGRLWAGADGAWIPGLAPKYIAALPTDPRDAVTPYMQYVYRSDGQNYKLLALFPEDCSTTVGERRELADPVRNARRCSAYGYWTPGAANW